MFENGVATKRYNQLINPNRRIPFGASAVNGIYKETVKNMPKEDKVCPEIIEFLGDAMSGNTILCAHNADFDMGFLYELFNNYNPNGCHINYVDTLSYSRALFNYLPNHKLNTVAKSFGITNENSHRAESDAEICGKIMLEILDIQKIDSSKKCDILDFSSLERDICRKIKTIIKNSNNAVDLLRFYKPDTKFVRVQFLFNVLKFKCLKNTNYLIISKSDADKYKFEYKQGMKLDGIGNVRVQFKTIEGLDQYGKYISDKYKKIEQEANKYIEASKIHRDIAKEKMGNAIIIEN